MSNELTIGLGLVTTDSADPGPLAQWWATFLGGQVVEEHDGWFYVVTTPVATLGFQKVSEPTPGKNRLHLDLGVEGGQEAVEEAVRRVVSSGGSLVADRRDAGTSWIVVADPDGNQFCLAPAVG